MVDYSKWDKLQVDDSDDEDDKNSTAPSEPTVTRFSEPRTITFEPAKRDSDEASLTVHPLQTKSTEKTSNAPTQSATTPSSLAAAASLSRNGADCGDVVWSQSTDSVVLRVRVPAGTRAKQVRVALDERRVQVSLDGRLHFDAALKFAVEKEQDSGECWELVDDEPASGAGRLVVITLRKKSLVNGLVHWWAQLRESDAPLDVTAFEDRQSASSSSSFASAWNDAHVEFRKRVAAREKLAI